jgi:hypothetical protein
VVLRSACEGVGRPVSRVVEGIASAKALNSEARCQEVIANWKEARKMWPHESRMIQMTDVLVERFGA